MKKIVFSTKDRGHQSKDRNWLVLEARNIIWVENRRIIRIIAKNDLKASLNREIGHNIYY